MRAVVLRDDRLVLDDVADPEPGPGQALLETIACGICGSDLHCARHAVTFTEAASATGMTIFEFDPRRDLVMGHEFSGRIAEIVPDVDGRLPPGADGRPLRNGDAVVAHPVIRSAGGYRSVGYSNDHPGGYAERFVVQSSGLLPIPDGTDPKLAALTEPLAVGLHAVNCSNAVAAGRAIVVGCGPVGLAVVAALRAQGVASIVAADLSPARRELAGRLGADVVVDPREEPAIAAWRANGGRGPAVVFEAVGVPGMLRSTMQTLPSRSELVVVGLCMEPDVIEPTVAISRELTLRFVLGWNADEFAASLGSIAAGTIDAAALVTGRVDLDGTAPAFEALGQPDRHVKILVQPNG